ncbi:uncharacterized protein LOC144644465 [Oculina patagonica]
MSILKETLPKAQKEELEGELKEFAAKVEGMNLAKRNAIEHLNVTADYLDKVWRDCRIASVAGNSAGILGGVLTIGGGIAALMTAGAAAPLLIAGIAFGAAGAGTNIGTVAAEAAIHSNQLQEAEKALQGAHEFTKKVKEQIQGWKESKNTLRLCFLAELAVTLFGKNHVVVLLIKSVLVSLDISADFIFKICAEAAIKTASEVATKAGAGAATITAVETSTVALVNTASKALAGATEGGTAGVKAGASTIGKTGASAGAKAAGGAIIGVSAVFLVWDAVDLGFNIRDLVEDKGCEAASYLREKAKELESSLDETNTSEIKNESPDSN